MEIQEVNKLINDSIKKYDLEGHETVYGGMCWFVLCLEKKESNCINDHFENRTYNFSTPKFDGHNADNIFNIIKRQSEIMEAKLKYFHFSD